MNGKYKIVVYLRNKLNKIIASATESVCCRVGKKINKETAQELTVLQTSALEHLAFARKTSLECARSIGDHGLSRRGLRSLDHVIQTFSEPPLAKARIGPASCRYFPSRNTIRLKHDRIGAKVGIHPMHIVRCVSHDRPKLSQGPGRGLPQYPPVQLITT